MDSSSEPVMISWDVAINKAYIRLSKISEQLPDELTTDHNQRVLSAVCEILERACQVKTIKKKFTSDLEYEDYEIERNNYSIIMFHNSECCETYVTQTSYIERDKFMQFVNEVASEYLELKNEPVEKSTATLTLSEKDKKALAELPLLKKKVAELSGEKDKWDASIEAAAKVGLLFYENGLEKPVAKDKFIKEFTEYLGEGLPASTIEKIYKTLPSEYKLKGGRLKKPVKNDKGTNKIDSSSIIAAVYTGVIYSREEEPDAITLKDLKKQLIDNNYVVPPDEMMSSIFVAAKDIFQSN